VPQQFSSGSKRTHTVGLVLEIQPVGAAPWVANFELGLSSYSSALVHPNGQDVVVIAGGLGYVVRPDDRMLVATFGGGIVGVWPVPKFNFLVFNDSDVAFVAMGSEGWRWRTRRISWAGFEAIEIAEKTIYGRAWNAVVKCWQPFSIEIGTGIVRGGAYFEAGQQRIALAREQTFRGGAPLHPFLRRLAEVGVGLLAIALVFLSVYLTVDSARTGELTWAKVRDYWGLAYALLFLTGVVFVLGMRLIFIALAPGGRLLTRSGIVAFFGLYLAMALVVFFNTGVLPITAVLIVACVIGGIATRKWFS
jgi:hypothetical protein